MGRGVGLIGGRRLGCVLSGGGGLSTGGRLGGGLCGGE